MKAIDRVMSVVRSTQLSAAQLGEQETAAAQLARAKQAYESEPTAKRWEAVETARQRRDQAAVRRRAAEQRETEQAAQRQAEEREAWSREIEELRARTAYPMIESQLRPFAQEVAAAAIVLARASAGADGVEEGARRDGARELALMRRRGDSADHVRVAEGRIALGMARVRTQFEALCHEAAGAALDTELGAVRSAGFDPGQLLAPRPRSV